MKMVSTTDLKRHWFTHSVSITTPTTTAISLGRISNTAIADQQPLLLPRAL